MNVPDNEVKVVFVDKNLKKAYEKLKDPTTEDEHLYKWLNRAFDDIKQDYTCGIFIPKKLIHAHISKSMALIIFGNTIYHLVGDYFIL